MHWKCIVLTIFVTNKDVQKDKRLKELGVSILRFEDKMVYDDMSNVLRTIEIYIDEFELNNAKPTPNPSEEGN